MDWEEVVRQNNFSVPNVKVFDGCHVDKSLIDIQEDHLFAKGTIQESVVDTEASD